MREIPLADLTEGAVTLNEAETVASFELPNPDDPERPIKGTFAVSGGNLQAFTDRSSTQKRFLAHHNL